MSDEVTGEIAAALEALVRHHGIVPTYRDYAVAAMPVVQAALTAARDQGYNEGIEAAVRYIQDQYPHDNRVLVPARRKIKGPTAAGICPSFEDHTQQPAGYIQWHAWAEKMGKTHKQRKCPGCGRYAIWEPKRCR